jgi:(1->4)-alpha-D-glucan 1-alpha-D-glucosylmutase
MAATDENPFWRDPELRARYFDLDPATGRHRRFFDVDELGGVRMEKPEVFETTHRLVLGLVREGLVDGMRIDHPDGLADPRGYLERLRDEGVGRIWVEKILEPGERLRDWPVEGTTGYEFLNHVQALFVDPAGERTLTELAGQGDFREVAATAKLEQAQTTFQPEVGRLRRLLDVPGLERALASLPVYRTYVEPWSGRVEDADSHALAGLPADLRRVLLLEERGHDEFVTRFQQATGPVMAKGVEDTAFYRYVRLLALNEVGGDPGRFGLTVDAFQAENAYRAEHWPRTLLPGTTHDTKRSADVRARIGAIAGLADRWAECVHRWHELNAPLRASLPDGDAPDWLEELFVYQTLAGAWPIGPDRLGPYLEKSLREAKRNTNWIDPDERWENAVKRFVRELFTHEPFLADFDVLAGDLAAAGWRSAIGQLVLRLTAPGVPDLYNGDELPYFALVDPDNRRPVDWLAVRAAFESPGTDFPKLHVIRQALALRARRYAAFVGEYEPLPAGEDTCAYRRGEDVVVAVPVRRDEAEFELPAGRWRNLLEGVEVPLGGYRPLLLERV